MALDRLLEVAEELNGLNAEGERLNRNSAHATYHPGKPLSQERIRFQRRLLDDLMAEHERDREKEGEATAVITAGPPGAGKSSMVRGMGLKPAGARVVDADAVKLKLVEAAVSEGIFDALLSHRLADGYPIMPSELSSLVHDESVFLADRMMQRCLEAKENVVIEGTFAWPGLRRRYMKLLDMNDYSSVVLLDVEVDRETAMRQAHQRWANGRAEAIAGRNTMGGRFTPRGAIHLLFEDEDGLSVCHQNAVRFFTDPAAASFGDLRLVVCSGADAVDRRQYRRIVGEYQSGVPTILNEEGPPGRS